MLEVVDLPLCISVKHDVFVDLHVGHGGILVFESTFEPGLASPEQRKLEEIRSAVAELTTQKKHAKWNVIAVVRRILDGAADLCRQFRGQSLIRIDKKDP